MLWTLGIFKWKYTIRSRVLFQEKTTFHRFIPWNLDTTLFWMVEKRFVCKLHPLVHTSILYSKTKIMVDGLIRLITMLYCTFVMTTIVSTASFVAVSADVTVHNVVSDRTWRDTEKKTNFQNVWIPPNCRCRLGANNRILLLDIHVTSFSNISYCINCE